MTDLRLREGGCSGSIGSKSGARKPLLLWGAGIGVLIVCTWGAARAHAAEAAASTVSGVVPHALPAGGGTTEQFAYSEQTLPTPDGPNTTVTHVITGETIALDSTGNPIPLPNPIPGGDQYYFNPTSTPGSAPDLNPGVNIIASRGVATPPFGPTVKAGPNAKIVYIPPPNPMTATYSTPLKDVLTSKSGGGNEIGAATYNAIGQLNPATRALQGPGVLASGFVRAAPGIAGRAAGAAFDPFELDQDISNYQENVTVSVDAGPMESAGATVFALDSRYTDLSTFYERGEPFSEALWSLSISGSDLLDDPSDLTVSFQINPAALADGVLFHDNGFGVNDLSAAAIQSDISSLITISGSVATLNSADIFPANTVFNVPDEGITYGESADAEAERDVPDPATGSVLGASLGILALLRRRR
ncbi:MAG: hypothetical protein ABSB74_19205 [Tepidisphaeraceae bacterium]